MVHDLLINSVVSMVQSPYHVCRSEVRSKWVASERRRRSELIRLILIEIPPKRYLFCRWLKPSTPRFLYTLLPPSHFDYCKHNCRRPETRNGIPKIYALCEPFEDETIEWAYKKSDSTWKIAHDSKSECRIMNRPMHTRNRCTFQCTSAHFFASLHFRIVVKHFM